MELFKSWLKTHIKHAKDYKKYNEDKFEETEDNYFRMERTKAIIIKDFLEWQYQEYFGK